MSEFSCSHGPVASLPGSMHDVPDGSKCDEHPDASAVRRLQGETDSFVIRSGFRQWFSGECRITN